MWILKHSTVSALWCRTAPRVPNNYTHSLNMEVYILLYHIAHIALITNLVIHFLYPNEGVTTSTMKYKCRVLFARDQSAAGDAGVNVVCTAEVPV